MSASHPAATDAPALGRSPDHPPSGITIYACEPDEAALFRTLAPDYGLALTLTSLPVRLTDTAVTPAPDHRCISVGHKSNVSAAMLRAFRRAGVEHISSRSIGLDHIDLAVADELGIAVENTSYEPDGVADFTLMLMLMALRGAKRLLDDVSRSDFRLGTARDRDLCDLTVGVVGTGRIGSAVITRLRGFGCRIVAHDPHRPAPGGVSLEELLRTSDIVTLHAPLTPRTRHLLGNDELASMKPGALLINTARGGIVDTAALIDALERGHLGGVALDVLEEEGGHFYVDRTTSRADHPFLSRLQKLPHAIVTPHTAYYTERALRDTVAQTLAKCVAFERNRAHE